MTFQLPERIATLVFEDGDLKGLELRVRLSVPFAVLFELQAKIAKAADSGEELLGVLHYFAEKALVGWNLADGADAVPLTPTSFGEHVDGVNALRMLTRYLQEVGRVPAPLALPSASGRTSRGRRGSKSRPS